MPMGQTWSGQVQTFNHLRKIAMPEKPWSGDERRKPQREALVSEIAAAVRDEISCLTVPEEIHREHHEFIREWIEDRKRKHERANKIKTQVLGWGAVSILGGIGTSAYHAMQYLREHLR